MFRDISGVEPNEKYFGSGSIMRAGGHEMYLVIGGEGVVMLFDLIKFKLVGQPVVVQDPNYLSEAETRDLGSEIQYTLSDFSLDCIGVKGKNLAKVFVGF